MAKSFREPAQAPTQEAKPRKSFRTGLSALAGSSQPYKVFVTEVVDGDTIRGYRQDGTWGEFRLDRQGDFIDAPERAKPWKDQKQEPGAMWAYEELRKRIENRAIEVRPRNVTLDRKFDNYGRELVDYVLPSDAPGIPERASDFIEKKEYRPDRDPFSIAGYYMSSTTSQVVRNMAGLAEQMNMPNFAERARKASVGVMEGMRDPVEPYEALGPVDKFLYHSGTLFNPAIGAGKLLESAPLITGAAVGTAIGGPVTGVILSGATLSGNNYEDLREKGVSHGSAMLFGNISALGEAAIETYMVNRLGSIFKGKHAYLVDKALEPGVGRTVARWGTNYAGGAAEETMQQIQNNLWVKTATGERYKYTDLLEGTVQAAAEGGILEMVMGAGASIDVGQIDQRPEDQKAFSEWLNNEIREVTAERAVSIVAREQAEVKRALEAEEITAEEAQQRTTELENIMKDALILQQSVVDEKASEAEVGSTNTQQEAEFAAEAQEGFVGPAQEAVGPVFQETPVRGAKGLMGDVTPKAQDEAQPQAVVEPTVQEPVAEEADETEYYARVGPDGKFIPVPKEAKQEEKKAAEEEEVDDMAAAMERERDMTDEERDELERERYDEISEEDAQKLQEEQEGELDDKPVRLRDPQTTRQAIVHRATSTLHNAAGKWQLSFLTPDGKPVSHQIYNSKKEALKRAENSGYERGHWEETGMRVDDVGTGDHLDQYDDQAPYEDALDEALEKERSEKKAAEEAEELRMQARADEVAENERIAEEKAEKKREAAFLRASKKQGISEREQVPAHLFGPPKPKVQQPAHLFGPPKPLSKQEAEAVPDVPSPRQAELMKLNIADTLKKMWKLATDARQYAADVVALAERYGLKTEGRPNTEMYPIAEKFLKKMQDALRLKYGPQGGEVTEVKQSGAILSVASDSETTIEKKQVAKVPEPAYESMTKEEKADVDHVISKLIDAKELTPADRVDVRKQAKIDEKGRVVIDNRYFVVVGGAKLKQGIDNVKTFGGLLRVANKLRKLLVAGTDKTIDELRREQLVLQQKLVELNDRAINMEGSDSGQFNLTRVRMLQENAKMIDAVTKEWEINELALKKLDPEGKNTFENDPTGAKLVERWEKRHELGKQEEIDQLEKDINDAVHDVAKEAYIVYDPTLDDPAAVLRKAVEKLSKKRQSYETFVPQDVTPEPKMSEEELREERNQTNAERGRLKGLKESGEIEGLTQEELDNILYEWDEENASQRKDERIAIASRTKAELRGEKRKGPEGKYIPALPQGQKVDEVTGKVRPLAPDDMTDAQKKLYNDARAPLAEQTKRAVERYLKKYKTKLTNKQIARLVNKIIHFMRIQEFDVFNDTITDAELDARVPSALIRLAKENFRNQWFTYFKHKLGYSVQEKTGEKTKKGVEKTKERKLTAEQVADINAHIDTLEASFQKTVPVTAHAKRQVDYSYTLNPKNLPKNAFGDKWGELKPENKTIEALGEKAVKAREADRASRIVDEKAREAQQARDQERQEPFSGKVKAKTEKQNTAADDEAKINYDKFIRGMDQYMLDYGRGYEGMKGHKDFMDDIFGEERRLGVILDQDIEKLRDKIKARLGVKLYNPFGKDADEILAMFVAVDMRRHTGWKDHAKGLKDDKRKIVERAEQINENNEYTDIIEDLTKITERTSARAEKYGLFEEKQNKWYIPHFWKFDKESFFRKAKTFKQGTMNAMERTLAGGLVQGWAEGLELETGDMLGDLQRAQRAVNQATSNIKMIKLGEKIGMFSFDMKKPPHGMVMAHIPAKMDENGNIINLDVYAPKNIAEHLENTFGESKFAGNAIIGVLDKVNQFLKRLLLLASLFHARAFVWSYALTLGTGGWDVASGYKKGQTAMEQQDDLAMDMIEAGVTATAHIDLEQSLQGKNFLSRGIKRAEFLLFERLGRNLKMSSAMMLANKELNARMQDMLDGKITRKEILKSVARRVNNDFGGIDYQREGINPTFLHGMKYLFLGHDWNFSNIRSMSDLLNFKNPQVQRMHVKLWSSIMSNYAAAFILTNLAMAGLDDDDDLVGRLRKAWHDGGDSWAESFYKIMDVEISPLTEAMGISEDERVYLNLMGHFKDLFKWVGRPLFTLRSKQSRVLGIGADVATGRDFFGKRFAKQSEFAQSGKKTFLKKAVSGDVERGGPLRHDEFQTFLAYHAVSSAPIPAQAIFKWWQDDTKKVDSWSELMGADVSVVGKAQQRFLFAQRKKKYAKK